MNLNFNEAEEIRTVNVRISGWKLLSIRYGLVKVSNVVFLIWNVVGTSHIFKVNLKTITENHGGSYEEHFRKTLIHFRKDLIDWYYNRNNINMSKYLDEFSTLITEIT